MIGIYYIKNIKNNKIYIGSSININKRIRRHFFNLQNNKHPNNHLQMSYNKYGVKNFTFEIIETFENIDRNELFNIEEKYIKSYDFNKIYNLTTIAKCGGAEKLNKVSLLLNLNGNLIKEFNSLKEIAIYLNIKQIPTKSINNPATIQNIYRIVTKDFYEKELELILSWRNYKKLEDKYLSHYKYNDDKNNWIIFHNDNIVATTNTEKDAIRISKHLVDLIKEGLI